MKYIIAALLTLTLIGCSPADINVNGGGLSWCTVDSVGYLAEVDGDDIHFVLEMVGVECE